MGACSAGTRAPTRSPEPGLTAFVPRTRRNSGHANQRSQPDGTEVQVERVKYLRYGEARGDDAQVVTTPNRTDPHAR